MHIALKQQGNLFYNKAGGLISIVPNKNNTIE